MITFDYERCVGCNTCVRVCPAPEANSVSVRPDGSISIVVNEDKCIKCGRCTKVCDHYARGYTDDTEQFLKDLKSGVPIIVITAPGSKLHLTVLGKTYLLNFARWARQKFLT